MKKGMQLLNILLKSIESNSNKSLKKYKYPGEKILWPSLKENLLLWALTEKIINKLVFDEDFLSIIIKYSTKK